MADTTKRFERGLRHQRMKRFASLQWDPWIVLAPDDFDRTSNIPKRRLDLGGMLFVRLRELPIEAPSSLPGKPRLDQLLKVTGLHVVDDRALEASLHDRPVEMRRQPQKCIHMATDIVEELRPPGSHRDDIHQNIRVEVAAMQQMRSQRRRPAHVMGNDDRLLEAPVRKHLREDLSLR